jgi:hypothetical protein
MLHPVPSRGRAGGIVSPTVATEGTVTPMEGVIGLYGKLTPACPSLSLAPGSRDGQRARPSRPPTLSVGESNTCVAEFGWRLRLGQP